MNLVHHNLTIHVCHGRVGRALVRRPLSTVPLLRSGFTFTEVMFAVILLGIGFIMLAGMFPVAIQQTQTNVEESTASTIAQSAAKYMEQTLTQLDVRPTIDNVSGDPFPSPYPRFFRLTERCDYDNINHLIYFPYDLT